MTESADNPELYTLMPLVYWFADGSGIPRAWQPRFGEPKTFWHGLLGAHRGSGYAQRPGLGPTGATGLLVTPYSMDVLGANALRCDATAQDWIEVEAGVWLGVAKAATAVDFLRSRLTLPVQYMLTVDERGRWLVPVGLLTAEHCNLALVDRFERGEWHQVAAPAYAAVSADAARLYAVEIGEADEPPRDEMREIVIRALQANHALTGPELAALGMLNDDVFEAVAAILTDRDARKKKPTDPDGAGT